MSYLTHAYLVRDIPKRFEHMYKLFMKNRTALFTSLSSILILIYKPGHWYVFPILFFNYISSICFVFIIHFVFISFFFVLFLVRNVLQIKPKEQTMHFFEPFGYHPTDFNERVVLKDYNHRNFIIVNIYILFIHLYIYI